MSNYQFRMSQSVSFGIQGTSPSKRDMAAWSSATKVRFNGKVIKCEQAITIVTINSCNTPMLILNIGLSKYILLLFVTFFQEKSKNRRGCGWDNQLIVFIYFDTPIHSSLLQKLNVLKFLFTLFLSANEILSLVRILSASGANKFAHKCGLGDESAQTFLVTG